MEITFIFRKIEGYGALDCFLLIGWLADENLLVFKIRYRVKLAGFGYFE